MSSDSRLAGRRWVYQYKNRAIYLYEINESNVLVKPSLSVTNGMKIEYPAYANVFVDKAGINDNDSPTEDSYLNADRQTIRAVIAYVRMLMAREAENARGEEKWRMEYYRILEKNEDDNMATAGVVQAQYPFAIRPF